MRGSLNVERIEHGKYCVYSHSIAGKVFYVGKGKSDRPFARVSRNKAWNKITEAAGSFDVEIIQWFDHNRDALVREAAEIKLSKPAANMVHNGYLPPKRCAEKTNLAQYQFGVWLTAKQRKELGERAKEARRSMADQVAILIEEWLTKRKESSK